MKFQIKILYLLFVFALLLTIFPCAASAADVLDNGICGENVFWSLTTDGVLTISGNGDMDDFSSFGQTPWYRYCRNGVVKTVIFLSGVRSVGDRAFYGCDSISEITLTEGLMRIGQYAFYSCGGLDLVFIPSTVTNIGWSALSGCRNLKNIQVAPNNEYYASDAQGVLYTKDFSTLLSAPGALSGSYIVLESTASIWSAFDNCNELLHVYLPKSLSSVSEGTFRSCKKLQGIWVDKENPYYFSDALGVLYGPPHWGRQDRTAVLCAPVTLSGSYRILEGTEVIECHSFPDCSMLTDVSIPQGVKEISYGSFANCTGLTGISIPDSVTFVDFGAFENCSGLVQVSLPDTLTSIEMTVFAGCSNLTEIKLPSALLSIGQSAFSGCSSLNRITIPKPVTSIGSQAFADCTELKEILFLGDAPAFEAGLFGEKDAFLHVSAVCLYPANNTSWTSSKLTDIEIGNDTVTIPQDPRQSYMGELVWKVSALKGDADGDGELTYQDALLVLRSSVGLDSLDTVVSEACNMDGDGELTYQDALFILRASIGLTN